MRIITRRKIYRAFPELDKLSDFQCDQLMRRIRLSVWRWLIIYAASLAGLSVCLVISAPTFWFTINVVPKSWIHPEHGRFAIPIILGLIALLLALSLVVALMVRDAVLKVFLRRGMRIFLKHTTCPSCKYQLIGQTVDEAGGLRCPECGRPTTLIELGLDGPEDLLPAASGDAVS